MRLVSGDGGLAAGTGVGSVGPKPMRRDDCCVEGPCGCNGGGCKAAGKLGSADCSVGLPGWAAEGVAAGAGGALLAGLGPPGSALAV